MWNAAFCARPDDVSATRRQVEAHLRSEGVVEVDTVTLLTSELLTNAVRHGSSPMSITVDVAPEAVDVSVHDASPEAPVLRPMDPWRVGGNGVRVVDQLATSWGTIQRADGKSVWFRLDRALP